MTDLDAIRERDAETTPYAVREGEYAQCKAAMDDRRALLAEVDRLTAELDDMTDTAAFYLAERARIRAAVKRLLSFDIRVDRALTPFDGPDYSGRYDMPPGEVVITALPGQGGLVDRAAVLAAIDGGGEPPLGGIEQFQDEDR